MDLKLDDLVVIVTGAAAGIGHATARLLTAEGATVVAVDRAPLPPSDVADHATFIQADLIDPHSASEVLAAVLARHGRVDALVNSVGGLQLHAGFLDISEDSWAAAFELNFHTARRMSQAVLPAMVDRGVGSIVHLASESARLPDVHDSDYAAAKAALLSMSKAIAVEFTPRGVRSNIVSPGPTRTALYDAPGGFGDQAAAALGMDKEAAIHYVVTELRPLLTGRIGTADEVARVVAYLVSPLSGQVTGADWAIDGGALRQI